MATSALGYQSFYQAQLTSAISDTDLTIPLDVVPTPSEGFLVLESTSASKREIIYYTSKTSNSVVCPAGGRGYDGTTAQSHLQNSAVIMAPVAAMFESLQDLSVTTANTAWTSFTPTWTNLTVGNSTTNEGYYKQIGKNVFFYVRFVFGSTSAVTGSVSIALPVSKASTLNNGSPIGITRYNDAGTAIYIGQITAAGTLTAINAAGTYAAEAFFTSAVPFTWTTNDSIFAQGIYEAA